MSEPAEQRKLVLAATTCAAVVVASQLAGKAARDGIFLQAFAVTSLPLLLAVSSALAVVATFVFARRMATGVPARVVQLANVASAALLLVEWALLEQMPRPIAILVFMHQTLLGPILVSGFWSVVSESFDPRTARRVIGTIGTGATLGGLLGAVLAERVAAMIGTSALLPTIAALQLLALWRLVAVGRRGGGVAHPEAPAAREVVKQIMRVSLIRRLALITVLVTVSAALLDYVFKAVVASEIRKPDDLTRLFATFHGVVGVSTALVQWMLGKRALQSWGLARTLATLPGAVMVFGAAALVAPGVGTFVALRGAENVLRNSLYREAYEVFYTPLLAHERRATKTVIDVGVERLGDVLGGLAVLALLALFQPATTVLLIGAVVLSVCGVIVALRAQHSYVEALERSLIAHAIEIDKDDEMRDRTTRATMEMVAMRLTGSHPRGVALEAAAAAAAAPSATPAKGSRRRWRIQPESPPAAPFRRGGASASVPSLRASALASSNEAAAIRLVELGSGDPARIRPALASGPLTPAVVAYVIPLLARRELAVEATAALAPVAPAVVGQLIDALRDHRQPLAARLRLPVLIAAVPSDLARAGLTQALGSPEFEVRAAVADVLSELRENHPDLAIDDSAIFESVRRELAGDPAVWKAIDDALGEAGLAAGSELTLPRAAKHLATLLALALPAEPIRSAIHNLWSGDQSLRGVALEYLENVLPDDIRERLWVAVAIEPPAPAEKRPLEDVLAELLRPRRPDASGTDLEAPSADRPDSVAVK